MSPFTKVFITVSIRIVLLLSLLTAEALYLNEKRVSPYFEFFRDQGVHDAMTELVGLMRGKISVAQIGASWNKLNQELNPEETEYQKSLESAMERNRSTEILVLKSGDKIPCRILKRYKSEIKVQRIIAGNTLVKTYKIASIASIKTLSHDPISLSPADVRFIMDYPELKHYLKEPFIFLTDGAITKVEEFARILDKLRIDFLKFFKPILPESSELPHRMHIIFFNSEEKYRRLVENIPLLEYSDGYYNLLENRLFIYNRLQSNARLQMEGELHKAQNEFIETYGEKYRKSITSHFEKINQENVRQLQEDTYALLRHEATHMFAYLYKFHSLKGRENPWLVEGLAMFCEYPTFKNVKPRISKLALIKAAIHQGINISLDDLVNNDSKRSLFFFRQKTFLAYQQSYALFCMLVIDQFRDNFFDYIREIRDKDFGSGNTRIELLAGHLGMNSKQLAAEFENFIITNSAISGQLKPSS